MHAEITVNGGRIFVRDDFPEFSEGRSSTPARLGGTPVTLHLEVADCDEAVKRAAAAGAKVTMPPTDAFWGARYAQIIDPFGHAWRRAEERRVGKGGFRPCRFR